MSLSPSQSQNLTIKQVEKQIRSLNEAIERIERKYTIDTERLLTELNRLSDINAPYYPFNDDDLVYKTNFMRWLRRRSKLEQNGELNDDRVSYSGAFEAFKWARKERRKQIKLENELNPLYKTLDQAETVLRWLKFKENQVEEDQELLAWKFYVDELARSAQ